MIEAYLQYACCAGVAAVVTLGGFALFFRFFGGGDIS
mgnify:CR=1 FL=1